MEGRSKLSTQTNTPKKKKLLLVNKVFIIDHLVYGESLNLHINKKSMERQIETQVQLIAARNVT